MSQAARIQAGAFGPGAGGPAARARPDPAPLPPELRVLHARRLAGHPRGRALRHGRDPHRRPGRVHPRGHAVGRDRVVAAAGIGRRPVAGPDVAGLGGHAGRDHRGVDARAPAARPARLGQRALRRRAPRPWRPRGRSRSPGCGRRTAACWTRARPPTAAPATAATACWCWRSRPAACRWTTGWPTRWS